LKP
jgi:hypothetical protein